MKVNEKKEEVKGSAFGRRMRKGENME